MDHPIRVLYYATLKYVYDLAQIFYDLRVNRRHSVCWQRDITVKFW